MLREQNRRQSAVSQRDVVKGLAGLALTTSIVGCAQGGGSGTQTTTTPTTKATPQGTTGKLLTTYKKHTSRVGQVAWASDGKRIASASADGTAQVWDALSGETLVTYTGQPAGVLCISWSPDGKHIVSGASGRNAKEALIQIWNAHTGSLLQTYTRPNETRWTSDVISTIGWSPDGKYIASGSVALQVWSPDTGNKLFEYDMHGGAVPISWLRWSPNSKRIATSFVEDNADYQNTFSQDALTGNNLVYYHTMQVAQVDWSPDGNKIVTGSASGLDIWDSSSGKNLHSEANPDTVAAVAWSPDGKRIASGWSDNQVRLWEPLTGRTVSMYKGHTDLVTSIAWSPDSSMIASVGADNIVQVWKIK